LFVGCEDDWMEYNGHCYFYDVTSRDITSHIWTDAVVQ
jgi:hypothetical protein